MTTCLAAGGTAASNAEKRRAAARARTNSVTQALVKGAIQKLLGVQSQMQGTRALAERALAQWTAAPAVQRGERVMWDSD